MTTTPASGPAPSRALAQPCPVCGHPRCWILGAVVALDGPRAGAWQPEPCPDPHCPGARALGAAE
ncbi:hypothetical protein [Streptomyces sp. Y1]|uniref:Uncharacterized protein n=1 Tax=Streptomyces sp. Y1 TaxID=3238634 RepID=A0AB39TUW9_9ACTN